jgi:hypothetical protein
MVVYRICPPRRVNHRCCFVVYQDSLQVKDIARVVDNADLLPVRSGVQHVPIIDDTSKADPHSSPASASKDQGEAAGVAQSTGAVEQPGHPDATGLPVGAWISPRADDAAGHSNRTGGPLLRS